MALDRFIGIWDMEALVDGQTIGVGATSTFEWIEEGAFLLERDEGGPGLDAPPEWIENSPFPVVSIIGRDDATEELTMLYSDGRGVRRVYRWSLDGDTWRMWRDAPGFNQRFTGTFDEAGATITGVWERSEDGVDWATDFELVYRKRN